MIRLMTAHGKEKEVIAVNEEGLIVIVDVISCPVKSTHITLSGHR